MAIVVMPSTNHEVPHANDDEDEPLREDAQEIQAQGMDNAPLDVVLHGCRVEMVPLDTIYVEGDQQDDDLVQALAHSIGLIGLQNPICIVENDIEGHPATYRLISGKKRLAAFLQLKRPTIPAHILSYAETDSEKDVRKALATTEENLVRKHYSLIELCELVGESKEMYERIHPGTKQGKAPKPKHSGTESLTAPVPKPLAYLDIAAQQLQKSRATVWKYLCIYNKLIQGQPAAFSALKQCDHPILTKLEDLQDLAKSSDLVTLTRLMCGQGMTPDDKKSTPCTLQEAQQRLAQYRPSEAQKSQPSQHNGHDHGHAVPQALPPQPAETPLPSSTLTVPAASSAFEMSTSQPHDTTTTPPPEESRVSTQHPETHAGVDTSPDEACETIDDVLIALEEQMQTYLRTQSIFKRFKVSIHKLQNELRITVQ